jgi:hypothetical protein
MHTKISRSISIIIESHFVFRKKKGEEKRGRNKRFYILFYFLEGEEKGGRKKEEEKGGRKRFFKIFPFFLLPFRWEGGAIDYFGKRGKKKGGRFVFSVIFIFSRKFVGDGENSSQF